MSMARRIRERVTVPLFAVAMVLFYAISLIAGLAYFAAERFRRTGMAAHAPIPVPATAPGEVAP